MFSNLDRFLKFVLTGGLAAVVNIVLRWVVNGVMPFELAVVASYLIAMTVAFVLSKAFVFDSSRLPAQTQFVRFAMVNVVSLVIVWAVSFGLYRFVFPAMHMDWYPDLVSHKIGVLSPVFAAYFLHKLFTFRSTYTALTPKPEISRE